MIKKELLDLINEQIKLEYESAFIYKSMSIALKTSGWDGFAKWMHSQYREEMAHAEEILDYAISRGETPVLEDIKVAKIGAKEVLEYFELAYNHECKVSKTIERVVAEAIKANDYATENFFRKFVDEQVEEEEIVGGIVDKMKMSSNDASYLFMDSQLGKREA